MFKEGDVLCSKYKLKRQFNKGGFSSVWLAEDLKAKRDFAIKIYAPDAGLDEDGINEFREEYNLVVNLNHSNILKPLTYDIHDNKPFLVMTYQERGSTSSLIGKITEEEAWKFAYDVASGLAYLHDKKEIVHQDIKPGNILIDEDGKYMITDFGISARLHKSIRMTLRQAQEMQEQNYGSGTPDYMGPERWPADGYIPPLKPIFSSDIWSLGATLFELMTGDVPFGRTGGAMQRQTHKTPAIESSFSKELKKLVYLCLSEKTWERPSAQQIADNALKHKAPQIRNHPIPWIKYASSGGISVAVLSGIAWYVWGRSTITAPILPNPNDSIFYSRVEQANTIVRTSSEETGKYENYAAHYVSKLTEARKLYDEAKKLEVSDDSILQKGEMLWAPSQNIIDKEYQYFTTQEQQYRAMEAESAADSFAQRREDIQRIVSEQIINKN